MGKVIDLAGQRFGSLVAISFAGSIGGNRRWLCQCDCGRTCTPTTTNLRGGNSAACGHCRAPGAAAYSPKHGEATKRTPTYISWKAMRARAGQKSGDKAKSYSHVTIDPRWDDYLCFKEDMGERPAGMSIDRKDNALGYFKENCRWATPTTQTRNRRNARRYTIDGRDLSVIEWADESRLSYGAAIHRLEKYGSLRLPNGL